MNSPLHIYVQTNSHSDVLVVGAREPLTQLRDALTAVLNNPSRASMAVPYAADGEGYNVYVVNTEILLGSAYKLGQEEFWDTVALPYLTLETITGISPWTVFNQAIINALTASMYQDFIGEPADDH